MTIYNKTELHVQLQLYSNVMYRTVYILLQETPPPTPTTPGSDTSRTPFKRAGSTASAGGGWVASPDWVSTLL